MLRAHLDCVGDPSQVAAARRFIRTTLAGWAAGRFEWAAEALVSELATNAVIHARTNFRVTVSLDTGCLVLQVADDSPLPPVRRRFESTATTGRGMRLVQALSSSWSVTVEGNSKVITCVLAEEDAGGRPHGRGEDVDVESLLRHIDADDRVEDSHSPAGPAMAAAA